MNLSGGQLKKLQIIRSLLHHPKILFLDEPTVGLDVESRETFYKIISQLSLQEGLTLIWTSHYLEEIEKNCDRAVILSNGRIDKVINMGEFRKQATVKRFTIAFEGDLRESEIINLLPNSSVVSNHIECLADDKVVYMNLLPFLVQKGIVIISVQVEAIRLEDIFLEKVEVLHE